MVAATWSCTAGRRRLGTAGRFKFKPPMLAAGRPANCRLPAVLQKDAAVGPSLSLLATLLSAQGQFLLMPAIAMPLCLVLFF
jgi:hypothetical protein